jgi:hypothetical protein
MRFFYVEPVMAYDPARASYDTPPVFLNCPDSILSSFRNILAGTPILGAAYWNPYANTTESIPDKVENLTSLHLQILARNESCNTSGAMYVELYHNLLTTDQIAKIRCLVKSTTVSGVVFATHTGGFNHPRFRFREPVANIVIDQAGLQWQDDYRNTGGLHFYPYNPDHDALPEHYQVWQSEMYEASYGYKRANKPSKNSLPVFWGQVKGVLDLDSIANAIAVEFSQALDAVVHQAKVDLNDDILVNFRFSKAGMGFFASGLSARNLYKLRLARLEGIELALKRIADLPVEEQAATLGKIGRITLPSSSEGAVSDAVIKRIETIVTSLGLEWGGVRDEDAFTQIRGYFNATTNCADPHAMPGNEGGPSSVDACISFNANISHLNALYNKEMKLRAGPEFVFEPVSTVDPSKRGFLSTLFYCCIAPGFDSDDNDVPRIYK